MLMLEQYVDIHVLEVCHEEGCYDLPMQQEDEPDPQHKHLWSCAQWKAAYHSSQCGIVLPILIDAKWPCLKNLIL